MPPARKSEKVRVIITGGTGFIGQLVARAILRRGSLLVHQPSGIEAEAEVSPSESTVSVQARPPPHPDRRPPSPAQS
jgi:nucleoside-diphosphate-sugar epimerase